MGAQNIVYQIEAGPVPDDLHVAHINHRRRVVVLVPAHQALINDNIGGVGYLLLNFGCADFDALQ